MKISVCMATYNGEKYIQEQLNSILEQLGEEDELIISDDSSTDRTIEIIERLKDNRIKLFKDNKYKNPCFNFENAISKASGDIIFLSDQDDIWKEDKVKICLNNFKESQLLLHNVTIVDNQMNLKGDWFSTTSISHNIIKNLIKNSFLGCAMVFKKDILNEILPFPKDTPMHDSWIGLVCEKYYNVVFLKDELMYYRRHGENYSSAGGKSKRNLYIKIKDRIILLKNLYKIEI